MSAVTSKSAMDMNWSVMNKAMSPLMNSTAADALNTKERFISEGFIYEREGSVRWQS